MNDKNIIIVDDDKNLTKMLTFILEEEGYNVVAFYEPHSCLSYLFDHSCELVIADYKMPKMSGIELLSKIKKYSPDTSVILLTAYGTVSSAVDAMKLGAYDFISKPCSKEELKLKSRNAIAYSAMQTENRMLKEKLSEKFSFANFVGKSVVIQDVFQLIKKVSKTDSTVLITGETGTGKEIVAHSIHYNSIRKDGPFVAVNCNAIPKELIASELFGHKKGAFTSAITDKKGKFLLADKGTLFLDDIGDITLDIQVQLLRAIQERVISPLGSEKDIEIDVRIIAATNKDIEVLIKKNSFREDLYHRINIFPIYLPPLRKRKDDIALLVNHFVKKYSIQNTRKNETKVTPEAFHFLNEYEWPGNVREVENAIERALILSEGGDILPDHLPNRVLVKNGGKNRARETLFDLLDSGISLEEVEKCLLEKALEKVKGNQTIAAKLLGISRATLIYRMEKYNLKETSFD